MRPKTLAIVVLASYTALDLALRWIWHCAGSGTALDLALRWIWHCAGSGTALDLALRWIWPAASPLVRPAADELAGGRRCFMGMGFWSMHYIGMLAYTLSVRALDNWPTVALSLVAAVLASAVALFVASLPNPPDAELPRRTGA